MQIKKEKPAIGRLQHETETWLNNFYFLSMKTVSLKWRSTNTLIPLGEDDDFIRGMVIVAGPFINISISSTNL